MKRRVVIELLQEFILLKPKRPFAEVQRYADSLHASYDEIKEAILNVSDALHRRDQASAQLKSKKGLFKIVGSDHLFISIKIGSAMAIFSIALLFLFIATNKYNTPPPLKNKSVLSSQIIQEKPGINNQITSANKIYANDKITDPKKIFSYPSSQITLKYTGSPKKEVFGFYPYWMLPEVDNISFDVFSSISIFALEIDGKGNIVTGEGPPDPGWSMWLDDRLDKLIKKAKDKRIKVYLTIKSFNKNNIEAISTSDEVQKKSIANIIQLVSVRNLDGVNIDFEYKDKANDNVIKGFVRFIANLNNEIKRQIPGANLSIDTYLSSAATNEFFDVQLLKDYVDDFVVMGYDVSTPDDNSGPVSPIEGESGIIGYMQSFLERVPPEKLILALPYYGYDWPISIEQESSNSMSADKNIRRNIGNAQILTYAEISALSKDYKIMWDETSQTPYYRYTDSKTGIFHEVHFDNTRSLGIKYDYIKNKNLKGLGIWAIGYDGLNQELQQLILEKFAN